jgi:hypothetical protein
LIVGLAILATIVLFGDDVKYSYMSPFQQSILEDAVDRQQQPQRQDHPTKPTPATKTTTTRQDSSTATVMAMATGYGLGDYQRFVGSLRSTGYSGHIILAVSPTVRTGIEEYLLSQDVTMRKVQYINCTHPLLDPTERMNGHDEELVTCVDPYPSLKHRWGRFPLLRDYLVDCTSCTGPVLITDMRDTIFQRDPFGPDAPAVDSLQVFEEHYTIRTTNWLVDWPVFDCKGIRFDKPMLCSGTTIGTRETMIEYLRIMEDEMNVWMNDPKCCCFKINGDDQSIHNYLFYSGKLDHIAVAVPNRMGLVNTVGAQAALISNSHRKTKKEMLKEQGKNEDDAEGIPFDQDAEHGNEHGNWLGLQYGMTDKEGYLVNHNGERSYIIHQIDRFGWQYYSWLNDHFFKKMMQSKSTR